MRKKLLQILLLFVTLTLLLVLQKPLFTLFVGGYSFADCLRVMAHGLSMDISVAGYFTLIPLLFTIARVWVLKNVARKTLNVVLVAYFVFISVVMASTCIANAALYPVWNFPLDATPLFYISSSPTAAMASESLWVWCGGLVLMVLMAFLYTYCFTYAYFKLPSLITKRNSEVHGFWRRLATSLVILVVGGLMIIPIRGGVTVSTMNVSRAYFSDKPKLNHAAVNPFFSLMYSVLHQKDFKREFRFMDNAEAEAIFESMRTSEQYTDSAIQAPAKIQLIILESFSSHLLPSLGGDSIAMRLDSIAREGLLFTNMYNSSFRTDRALPAILNAYPGLPTTSLMKYVNKFESLPSIANNLASVGYNSSYYYGGDINYCNFNGLLVAGGYSHIVSDKDFPIAQRQSKWGAHDDVLFQRVYDEMKAADPEAKEFSVIQTSSSHEPYEVPYQGPSSNIRVNAFQYTDSVLGAYVDSLKALPYYDDMLLVIMPDHYGSYPMDLEDHYQRHRMPLILAGGAASRMHIDPDLLNRIGCQTDVAATILSIAKADYSDFRFSNNLLDPKRKEFAYFSEPTWIGMVTPEGFADIVVETKRHATDAPDSAYTLLKAYIQTLYNDIDQR